MWRGGGGVGVGNSSLLCSCRMMGRICGGVSGRECVLMLMGRLSLGWRRCR